MSGASKGQPTVDLATEFRRLLALFEGHPDVRPGRMFGAPCLKLRGKVFRTAHSECMVFRLPPEDRARALNLEDAARWNPSGRAVLREWVSVPAGHHGQFDGLARAAARFIGGAS